MKPFAVLIFEINCYQDEPLVKIQVGKNWELGRKPKDGQASVWLHVASEERWKEQVPPELEENCLKICGPADWQHAEKLIGEMKICFDQLGVEHSELTCSDD